MNAQMPAEPKKSPPPWLVPAGIGMVIALLVVFFIVMLNGGDDDDVSAPSTTEAAPATTVAVTASAPVTTVATTEAAATTTDVETTVPETTIGFEEPPTLSPGEATILSGDVFSAYTIAVACSDFWAGVETTSHVLVDDGTGAVWVVNTYAFEEGGPRGLQAVDMAAPIASDLYGQDVSIVAPKYSGSLEEGADGTARTTALLISGDGPLEIAIAIAELSEPSDCSTGSLSGSSPFPTGTQVEFVSADDAPGTRFNVLAKCGGELLLSGGSLLVSFYPEDGNTMIASLSNNYILLGEEVTLSNFVTPEPEETSFEMGGGGDALAAINVFREGNRSLDPSYLQWVERPLRSAVGGGGLLDEVCPNP